MFIRHGLTVCSYLLYLKKEAEKRKREGEVERERERSCITFQGMRLGTRVDVKSEKVWFKFLGELQFYFYIVTETLLKPYVFERLNSR